MIEMLIYLAILVPKLNNISCTLVCGRIKESDYLSSTPAKCACSRPGANKNNTCFKLADFIWYVEKIVLALFISTNDRLVLATLVIYQHTNCNAVYQTKITQTGDCSLGCKPVIPQYTCGLS